MKLYCKKCGIKLNLKNIDTTSVNIDGSKIKRMCKKCSKILESELKNKYFAQEYKMNNIYSKDGKYVPYWGCNYYFKSLEDCKKRIDNKNIACVNMKDFYLLNEIMKTGDD
ncbi:hypothetical protein CF086_17170 [Clostridium botulinum]|uniref:hypothetical protein n=1 Tax=Clostridium botulinum TaxID=1491 RepID=UPI000773FF43|nr:hypothetical protein [Clostridium botulinum]MBN3352028.1 hypothetical protein [Clostridium botulinum]